MNGWKFMNPGKQLTWYFLASHKAKWMRKEAHYSCSRTVRPASLQPLRHPASRGEEAASPPRYTGQAQWAGRAPKSWVTCDSPHLRPTSITTGLHIDVWQQPLVTTTLVARWPPGSLSTSLTYKIKGQRRPPPVWGLAQVGEQETLDKPRSSPSVSLCLP